MSIRKKFIVFIGLSTVTILCTAFLSGYFYFYLPRLEAIGSNQARAAQQLAYALSAIIDERVRDFPALLAFRGYGDVLAVANSRYRDINPEEIISQMQEIDRKWPRITQEGSYRQYLDRDVSDDLHRLQKQDSYMIGELLLTDAHGGLVAASGKTTDYYQADEEWWRKAVAQKGNVYVGEAEYDASSGVFSVPLAFALRDTEHHLVGVFKVVVDINAFFYLLVNYEKQEDVSITLLNSRNEILFHAGVQPLSRSLPEFEAMEKSGRKWMIVNDFSFRERPAGVFLAYADVVHPWFVVNGLHWKVIIVQDKDMIMRPLYLFLLRLVLAEGCMLALLLVFAFIFGTMTVKPLEKLSRGTEVVAAGDLDYQVNIHSGDEVERLAKSFNKMTQSLQQTNLKREQAEDNLKRALKIKSEFTSTVSHELKTPLAAIREGVQLVVDGSLGPVNAEQKDCLQIVKGNIERLVRLINDILDFQRLESGRMVFDIKPNDLHALIREVVQTMAFSAQKKGLDLSMRLGSGPLVCLFDRDKIAQVLSNILSNAIKFTEKGSVVVSVSSRGPHVLVSVEDTGIGIKREDIPKLFQRFAQIQEKGYRKTGGTGLGLVISREIIKHHQGDIWIEPGKHQGAVVCFTLPLQQSSSAHA